MSYGNNKTTKKIKGWNVKDNKTRPDPNPFQRIDLNPTDFDRLIQQKGVGCKVFRTLYCPNVKTVDSGEHEIDCPHCNGSGYLDVDPLCTLVVIQTQELEMMFEGQDGYHDGNTVLMSFPIGVELQYFTRIELEDYTQPYYQRLMRKPGTNFDVLKYKACRINVVSQIVAGVLTFYFQDQDFKLDANGDINWTGSRKPADNAIYSVHYECHVIYRTVKAMHANRYSQFKTGPTVEMIKYPEQWMCTKEFLLRRKDIQSGSDLLEGPFSNHTNTDGDNT